MAEPKEALKEKDSARLAGLSTESKNEHSLIISRKAKK